MKNSRIASKYLNGRSQPAARTHPLSQAATSQLDKAQNKQQEEAKAEFARALAAYESGHGPVFAAALRRTLELDPNNVPGLVFLANLNLQQGNMEGLSKLCYKILELDKNNLDATIGMGVFFFQHGKTEMARTSFKRALTISPNNFSAQEYLEALELSEASGASAKARGTFLIHSYNHNPCSAGVRVLHYLAAMLRAADIPVAVTHRCFYNPTIPVRMQALPGDIVVYPDASRGNPLGARRICRYMMYYASVYYGGDRIAKGECAVVFHRNYLADVQAHCDFPLTEDDIVTFPILDKEWCFPEEKTIENVLYEGKGRGRAVPKMDFIEVAPANCRGNHLNAHAPHYAHMRTLAVLRKARNFYTMDENTLMSCEAALCGCNVFYIKADNTIEEQVNIMDTALPQVMFPGRDMGLARKFAERIYHFFDKQSLAQAKAQPRQPLSPATSAPPEPTTQEKPQVSIVIPTFNKLDLTRRCLHAISANTPSPTHEVIVVDNGSTDGTVEFLRAEEAAGRLRAILNTENTGYAKASNLGARAAHGKYLLFLNNDTEVQFNWLSVMVSLAEADPKVAAVGSKLLYADGRIQHAGVALADCWDHDPLHAFHIFAKEKADFPLANQRRIYQAVTGACMLVRKANFDEAGGLDEQFWNGCEDADLCLRFQERGWLTVYEPASVVIHHESQSGPERFRRVTDNIERFHRKWLEKVSPDVTIGQNGKSVMGPGSVMRVYEPPTAAVQHSAIPSSPPARANPASVSVTWDGSFLDMGSLSHVNRELVGALSPDQQFDITLVSQSNTPVPSEFKELARRLKTEAPRKADVTVRHAWPPNWQKPATGAWVLIQPWEFGILPADWVKNLSRVDEVWAPTEYVRRVYVESGVPPFKVKVVPNGIDPARFRPDQTPLPLATSKKFKFLFVGGTIHRKGPDVLLKAYLESFSAADDVCLVIKDFGGQSIYRGQTLEKQIAAARQNPSAPEILYLTDELPQEAMPHLYAACQCLVHPYRGEGFGLPVLEAMACGLSVVVTGGGATDDFTPDKYAYRLPSQRQDIGRHVGDIKLERNGWWLEPDASALAARLRWVVAHPEEARKLGHAASEYVRREWTWERAAQIAGQRLRDLAGRKKSEKATPSVVSARKSAPVALPQCALMGNLGQARELARKKQWPAAWKAASSAISARPYHPEAYLLLAEVAQAAGDGNSARRCATAAREMAPGWAPAKQFLKRPLGSGGELEWLTLPPALSDTHAAVAPRVSVCLITKNEERFLSQCLQSVRALASQIVVMDTGSTDRTVDIARELGAEVHSFAWCDDFSAARNAALEHATGDWVLIMDADEELIPEQVSMLTREIQAASVMGYRLPIIDHGREEAGCSYVPRLFRNAPGLFFVGRIHEQVFSSIQVRCQQWGLKHLMGKTTLRHHGYSDEVMASRNKVGRNLRLLELAVEDMPGQPNLIMNLGLELIRSGKMDAGLDRYWEAFRLMSAMPPSEVTPELRETLLTQMPTHLMAAKRFSDIIQLWQIPFAKNSGLTASQHFCLGLAHMELKQPAEAAEQMRQCLAKRDRPALSPINLEIHKAGPQHCLALCLASLNDAEGALRAFEAALTLETSSRPVRFDLAGFHVAHGRTAEALKILRQLASENPTERRVWDLGGQIALSRGEHLDFARDWTADAVKHFPQDQSLLCQHAESLLFTQKLAEALPLWRQMQPGSTHQRAALVLCELLTGDRQYHFASADEPALSKEVLQWYRQAIRLNAHALLNQWHQRIEAIRLTLPTFVRVLEAAHAQARQVAA